MTVEQGKTYIGIIQNNEDPNKNGRCKVRVIGVFDEMPVADIPWASPWKDLNGNGFNLPEVGKAVTVVFDSGNIYKPEYIYSEFYNVNLEKKLKSLSGKNYTSMKSVLFDHKSQIYVNDEEGLKLDYKFNNINITEDEINLNLKDNFGKINIGDAHPDQQSILGTNFLNWFDKFIMVLMNSNGPAYLQTVPPATPTLPSPALIKICQEYQVLKDPKFLSRNIYMNDNEAITSIKNDTARDANLRINDPQVGDNIKTTVETLKTEPKVDPIATPKDGNGTETPQVVNSDGTAGSLSPSGGSVPVNGGVPSGAETPQSLATPLPPTPEVNTNVDKILTAMRKKKNSKGEFYKIVETPYYINLVGIRNQYEGEKYSNVFKDRLWAIWKDQSGKWQSQNWAISTMPGLYHSKNPKQTMKEWCISINPKTKKPQRPQGLGIMVPGQYKDIYRLSEAVPGKKGFLQSPYFMVNGGQYTYRDQNWNSDIITFTNKSTALKNLVPDSGMLIHRGFGGGVTVDNWSEGCQVFSKEGDYKQLIEYARYHITKNGNKFNYTLLEGKDVV